MNTKQPLILPNACLLAIEYYVWQSLVEIEDYSIVYFDHSAYIDVSSKVAPALGIHDVTVVFVEEPTCPHSMLLHGGGPWREGRWDGAVGAATV